MTVYQRVHEIRDDYELLLALKKLYCHREIAELTGYSIESVQGWSSKKESPRWRPIPPRAMEMVRLKLKMKEETSPQ